MPPSTLERKRSRRLAVIESSWGLWLLPFIVLAVLLAVRSSIVHMISEGEGHKTPSTQVAERTGAGAKPRDTAKAAGAQGAPVPPDRYQFTSHCSNTCFKASDGVCDEGWRPRSNVTAAGPGTTAGGGSAAAALAGGATTTSSRHRHLLHRHRRRDLAGEGNTEVSELLCDLGTDCADCGPWVGTVPQGWDDASGPVAWMRTTHNASLFVRRTATPRPFLAAITHHQADPDVSAMLWHYGAMEGGITRIMHHVLNGQCETPASEVITTATDADAGGTNGGSSSQQRKAQLGTQHEQQSRAGGRRRRLVVDVGANFGYYTVQAALYGCSVVAFEPVRKFRALLEWSVHAAGVAERVTVVDRALSDVEGPHRLVVPRDGSYWGLASVNGVNVLPHEALETLTINATTLDSWEHWAPPGAERQDLLLVKMDIEGWEANVLQGGSQLLAHHGENVLLEYSPGIYERNNRTDLAPQAALPASLALLSRAGFSLAHLPLFAFAAPWPPRPITPEEPLPAFEEVTAAALQHDLEAIEYRRRMELDPGGCPLPPNLTAAFGVWKSCREWTYATHPKGFRSAFGFNTNVWAARQGTVAARKLMRLQGVAALFDEGQDMKVWTSQRRPGAGLGLTDCASIGSGHLQLFRCACPPTAPPECLREQELVVRLAAEGKMPFTGPG